MIKYDRGQITQDILASVGDAPHQERKAILNDVIGLLSIADVEPIVPGFDDHLIEVRLDPELLAIPKL